jgi:Domain of unknown function (DUF1508)
MLTIPPSTHALPFPPCATDAKFRLHLKAPNGEIIAASQGYETKANVEKGRKGPRRAEKGIEAIKTHPEGSLYHSPMPLANGVVFAGYQIIGTLGSGRTREVYLN